VGVGAGAGVVGAVAGSDLFSVVMAKGTGVQRAMVCIETNSCPSGQKSMPWPDDHTDRAGYRLVLERGFADAVRAVDVSLGALAVLYDKNVMEASGYAAAMAELFGERVYLTEFYDTDPDPPARWEEGLLHVRTPELRTRRTGCTCTHAAPLTSKMGTASEWVPVRAAFRYVTQRPWHRIPIHTRTVIFNSVRPLQPPPPPHTHTHTYMFTQIESEGEIHKHDVMGQ
jgi:hypothetical protein